MTDGLSLLVARWRHRAVDSLLAPEAVTALLMCAKELDEALGGEADVGHLFVLAALRDEPGLSTTELRVKAKDAGVGGLSVTRALPILVAQGLIRFDVASRGRKRWYLRGEPAENGAVDLVPSLSDKLNGSGAAEVQAEGGEP